MEVSENRVALNVGGTIGNAHRANVKGLKKTPETVGVRMEGHDGVRGVLAEVREDDSAAGMFVDPLGHIVHLKHAEKRRVSATQRLA